MLIVGDEKELSEINVTPFIDVMLVLLIIFMVVAPMITSSVKLELPKSTQEQKADEKKPVILFLNEEELSVNEELVGLENLNATLDSKTKGDKDSIVYFYVDKAVPYERLMLIIDTIKSAGYGKIALSSEFANK